MSDVAQLGLAVDSSQVKSATTALNQLTNAGKSAAQSANTLAASGAKSETVMRAIEAAAKRANISTAEMQARIDATSTAHQKLAVAQQTAIKTMADMSTQARKAANDNVDLAAKTTNTTSALDKFATRFTRGLIVGAAVTAIRDVARYVWELNAAIAATADTAQRVNVGGQQFQGLQTAAAYKGVGNDSFNSAMLAFNQQIDLAKHGLGDLQTLLASNGKTVGDTATTFGIVADMVRNAASQAEKFSILQQAGLPATVQFVQLMEQGSAAIQAQVKSASKLTDQQLEDAKRINDQWNIMWANFENWGKRAIVNTANAMKGLTFAPTSNLQFGQGMLRRGEGGQLTEQQADQFYSAVGIPANKPKRVTVNTPTFNPERAKMQIALEQQRLSLLGPLATAEDVVKAKQLEINSAALNNVHISGEQAAALRLVALAQFEVGKVQQQSQVGVFDLAAAQKAYNDQMKAAIAQHLIDPNNPQQYAAATIAAAKSIEQLAQSAKAAGAPLEQLQRLANAVGDLRGQLDTFATGSLNSLTDALVGIGTGAQSAGQAFKNFGLQVVTALEKMIIQMTIIKPLADSLQSSFGGGGILGFLGLGGSSGALPLPGAPNFIGPVVAHTGGIVGSDMLPNRYVHPAYFDNAPRFHTGGIVAGEVPIIARRGEGVFTPGQMAAMGGSNVNVSVNVENHNGSDVQVGQKKNASGGVDLTIAVRDLVNRNLANGSHDKAMAARYGATPRGLAR